MGAEIVSVKSLFWALGIVFAAGAVTAFVTRGSTSGPTIGLAGISALLIAAAFSWSWLETVLGPRLVQSIYDWSSDFRVWLALLAVAFLGAVAGSIFVALQRDRLGEVIETDIVPMRRAMAKWVLPRALTQDQIATIAKNLKKHAPFQITLVFDHHDQEASEFANDIQRAIDEGGWRIRRDYRTLTNQGLHINFIQPIGTSTNSRELKPNRILEQSLHDAGVPIGGSGGGGNHEITTPVLEVHVGPRPSGREGYHQTWSKE